MIAQARRGVCTFLAMAVALTFAVAAPVSASAQGLFSQPRYAAIVVDASNGEVLYSKRADALRYPASITKIMTLYLTFEALSTGRLKLTDRVPVSVHAYNMAPSKSTLRPGESLSVDDAIRIVAVHSANDIAVALAEKIAGAEPRFAALMTLRAQELGMAHTHFVNAHGLPDPRQVTTARDFALLARAVMRDYPQYFHYFDLRDCVVAGKFYTNHNHLLREPGYDGFKTGFTNAAGYNLVASAVRDNRRLITVVLGGSSAALRDENVQTLMNAGFEVLKKRSLGERTTIAQNIAEPDDSGPIQPGVEEGDGGRGELSAVVVDPIHGVEGQDQLAQEEQKLNIDAAKPPPAGPAALAAGARVRPKTAACAQARGHHHRAKVCAGSAPVETAAVDCSGKHGKAKRVCERTLKVGTAQRVKLAAADCAGKHGRAKRTCDRAAKTGALRLAKADVEHAHAAKTPLKAKAVRRRHRADA
jgi:D-alanyl-D-alanine carboxypeptidase (penicillin-binding protein 5/6)